MKSKIETLAKFLDIDFDDAENYFDNGDYLILTDDEANEQAKEYIEQSLWAFNADFLADMTDLPSEVFEIMQKQCESSNDAVLKLVEKTCGLDKLAETAISMDGRGHFISSYDCEENELNNLYIYRIN